MDVWGLSDTSMFHYKYELHNTGDHTSTRVSFLLPLMFSTSLLALRIGLRRRIILRNQKKESVFVVVVLQKNVLQFAVMKSSNFVDETQPILVLFIIKITTHIMIIHQSMNNIFFFKKNFLVVAMMLYKDTRIKQTTSPPP